MIQTTIVAPASLPAFAVPDTAPNYWQELAAWTWVSNISAMSTDGHKIRQDDLVDGKSVARSLHDAIMPWVDDTGEELAWLWIIDETFIYIAEQVGTIFSALDDMRAGELTNIGLRIQQIEPVIAAVVHWLGQELTPATKGIRDNIEALNTVVDNKPTINPNTPNLIDDFFSNVEVDSDAIKVALQAIQSILTGGNVVLDLIKEAILEQVAGGDDSSEALNLIASRLLDEAENKNVAEALQGLSVMPSELSLHINNIARKDLEDYQESWRAS